MAPSQGFSQAAHAVEARPFTIGLRPIAAAAWLTPDAHHDAQIAEKRMLLAQAREVVVRCRADTRAAQTEVLALVAAQARGSTAESLADPEPIVDAALTVQDDLVLMRREQDGWRLVAACLCFPSTWSLAEKFDRPMDAIHAGVPGYAGAMATRVARIFDHLPCGQIVERFNWSIYPDDRLHHPQSPSGLRRWRELASPQAVLAQAFMRVERQTLRRLPESGDILFTIRVIVDPLAALMRHPDGRALAGAIRAGLAAMTPEQLAYKNLAADRDVLLAALDAVRAHAPGPALDALPSRRR